MAEYHVGCGWSGIFAGRLNKNGDEWVSKSDVTTEAIHAVMLHLLPDNENEIKCVTARHNNGQLVRLTCEYIDEEEVDE